MPWAAERERGKTAGTGFLLSPGMGQGTPPRRQTPDICTDSDTAANRYNKGHRPRGETPAKETLWKNLRRTNPRPAKP
ncbi:MAG: hypothetical protein OXU61_14040, partial [Gammaproteobacteria bacterium]|nr:hypothetical protein [Gammaproteobacteria bacterium]